MLFYKAEKRDDKIMFSFKEEQRKGGGSSELGLSSSLWRI
jgi:hypothetical protein